MPPRVMSTRQAATDKQCTLESIVAAVKRGAIDGQKMGHDYAVFPNKKYREWEPNRLRQQIGRESQKPRGRRRKA